MKDLPQELIYALAFGAILLFQYLVKRFGPEQLQDAKPEEPAPEFFEEEQETPAASWILSADVADVGSEYAPSIPTLLPHSRFSRRALMGTRRNVKNAVVIATILGPCRAFEPHDIR